MEMGRGGACVPARVAPQGRIHRSIPRAPCVCFWHGNAAARTFGRARRRRPYGLVWVDCVWAVDVVWVNYARGRLVAFGWIVCKWLFCLCGIAWKNITEMGRGGACLPACVALQGCIHRSIPRAQCMCFWAWKRRCADVRAGTQAPSLRVSFEVEWVGGVNCAPRCRCPRRPSRV